MLIRRRAACEMFYQHESWYQLVCSMRYLVTENSVPAFKGNVS